MQTGHAKPAEFVGGVACVVLGRKVAHFLQEGFILVQGLLMLARFVGGVRRVKRVGPICFATATCMARHGEQEPCGCEKEGLHVHACSVRWAKDRKVSAKSSAGVALAP